MRKRRGAPLPAAVHIALMLALPNLTASDTHPVVTSPDAIRHDTIGFIFDHNSAKLTPMDSKQLAKLCSELADNKKAENILVLDVRKLSTITDFFVIVSGTSSPHLRAIVNEIDDKLRADHELRPRALDGNINGDWVVLDYFDVIVHVMRAEVRQRYDLEGLWGDAPQLKQGIKPNVRASIKPSVRHAPKRKTKVAKKKAAKTE